MTKYEPGFPCIICTALFLFYVQLRPLREALSDAQIDRERMTDQLERLLSANKELQDNMEVLQTELGRKQVEYDNLLGERYDSLDYYRFLGNCPPTPPQANSLP